MRDYILLNNYRFRTPAKDWEPVTSKPASVRYDLNGNLDVTFGSKTIQQWRGSITAPVTPDAPGVLGDGTRWGTIADLRAILALRTSVAFVDHYAAAYTAYLVGENSEKSLSPKWDSPSNEFKVDVRIVV